MTCGVCLTSKAESINVFSEQGIRLEICAIIKEHFWFEPVEEDAVFNQICQICWEQLASFHVFYSTVKQAHQRIARDCYKSSKYSESSVFYLPVDDNEDETNQCKHDTSEHQYDVVSKVVQEDFIDSKEILKLPNGTDFLCKQEKLPISGHNALYNKCDTIERLEQDDRDCIPREMDSKTYDNVDSPHDKETVLNNVTCNNHDEQTNSKSRIRNEAKIQEEDELILKYINLDCETCSLGFKKFLDLSKHYQTQHQTSGFVRCCDKKLFSRTYILDHINKHLNPDRYECKKCNKAFGSQYSIKNHMLMKHAPGKEEIYECVECVERFPNQISLDEHSYTHLTEENRRLYCCDCRKLFISNAAIHMHRNVYHKKVIGHICHVCGEVIPGKAIFLKHINDHARHLGDAVVNKPICCICGKLSASIKALRHHIRYVHSSDRPHKCCVCGKSFKLRQKLREHLSSHNVGVSLPCPYCHKRFRSKFHLYSHKYRMHKKEYGEEKTNRSQTFDCAYQTYDVPLLYANEQILDTGNFLSQTLGLSEAEADFYNVV